MWILDLRILDLRIGAELRTGTGSDTVYISFYLLWIPAEDDRLAGNSQQQLSVFSGLSSTATVLASSP